MRQFKLVAKLKPDVVLMDLRLPTMDGIQATREIKKVHPDAAIIILFGYDDDVYVAQARRSGAGGYPYQGRSRFVHLPHHQDCP